LSQFMYQINMEKSMCYVNSSQINEIIGKELWVDGEWHSLSNLTTGWLVTLSHGANKKDKQDCKEIKEEKINFSVGELVVVMSHRDAWTHRAHLNSLNINENATMIKWESTGKSDYIEITDLKKNLEVETSQRKQKATEFLHSLPLDAGKYRNKQHILATGENPSDQVQVQNKFYSIKNMSKLCSEGAIKNLLSMLNYSQSNIDSFWNLCNAPVSELMEQLHEKCVPKAILNVHCTVNPIKKCLWIL
jgi:hypothetical protein